MEFAEDRIRNCNGKIAEIHVVDQNILTILAPISHNVTGN
jgi:hypothetical protein